MLRKLHRSQVVGSLACCPVPLARLLGPTRAEECGAVSRASVQALAEDEVMLSLKDEEIPLRCLGLSDRSLWLHTGPAQTPQPQQSWSRVVHHCLVMHLAILRCFQLQWLNNVEYVLPSKMIL